MNVLRSHPNARPENGNPSYPRRVSSDSFEWTADKSSIPRLRVYLFVISNELWPKIRWR